MVLTAKQALSQKGGNASVVAAQHKFSSGKEGHNGIANPTALPLYFLLLYVNLKIKIKERFDENETFQTPY